MRRFDDFDAWGEAVNGAHLTLTCDRVKERVWTLGVVGLGDVVLQVASEGGGNLCYGGNTHAGTTLFVPLTHASEHVVNGTPLDADSLFAITRGADFTIRVKRRPHSWCSIALPPGFEADDLPTGSVSRLWTNSLLDRRDAIPDAPHPRKPEVFVPGESPGGLFPRAVRVACPPGSVRALRNLVADVSSTLIDLAAGSPAHAAARSQLLEAARVCFSKRAAPRRPATGRPRIDRLTVMRRAMAAIEEAQTLPTAADLAHRVAVTDRTLLRAFHETFGLPPKKYLMLRQLHQIQRVLKRGVEKTATIADVLARHGIWEFGRFAGRYRGHFGELPSETLLRSRA